MNADAPGLLELRDLARSLDRIEAMATAAQAHLKRLPEEERDDVALHLFEAINREAEKRAGMYRLQQLLGEEEGGQ